MKSTIHAQEPLVLTLADDDKHNRLINGTKTVNKYMLQTGTVVDATNVLSTQSFNHQSLDVPSHSTTGTHKDRRAISLGHSHPIGQPLALFVPARR